MSDVVAAPAGPDQLNRALFEDLDAGFVALFETYQGLVFSVALRLSGRWADAEDITAEAFLRAYRALAGYDSERIAALKVRPWLLTIVMNLGRNRWRTASRKPPPEALDTGGGADGDERLAVTEPSDEGDEVEAAALRQETRSELAHLLEQLPDEQRAAVVLRHVVDLPVAEIATVLGLPQGAVKSHISRGLRRLRALTPTEEATDVPSR